MKKIILILLLILHILILSQLQFTAWPEMVSFPYLINHGFITYRDMVHTYPPLLINILAVLYKIFGYNIGTLKIFGWISFIINDLLIFLIIRKLTQKTSFALIGVFSYVVLQPILEGNMVWPDLVMIPFLLLGTLLIFNKKYFWSGIAFALALLTKQTAILYLVSSILYIAVFERKFKNLIKFVFGLGIVILPFVFSLIYKNSLKDFINWTIIYPSRYWTKFPGYVKLGLTLREGLILILIFTPIPFLFLRNFKKNKDNKFYLILGFIFCGILGVYPRFSFFHLQPAIAFFQICFAYLLSKQEKFKWLFWLPILGVVIISFRNLQFGGSRFWENSDLILAQKIQKETPTGEPIYLLGLSSSLYTFADRVPNKPWLDNFGWYLEIPGVQKEVLDGFEKEPPSTIFWATPNQGNWYDIGVYQPKEITDWIIKNYENKQEIEKGIWEWVKKS